MDLVVIAVIAGVAALVGSLLAMGLLNAFRTKRHRPWSKTDGAYAGDGGTAHHRDHHDGDGGGDGGGD